MVDEFKHMISFYTDRPRHWCPKSQRYAGGDALLTHLNDGWKIQGDIHFEEYWHGGSRRILIYYFVLTQNDQWITMRVQGNPFIDRLLAELRLPVIPTAAVRARSRQPQRMSEQIN
jgi:hypothetical protein